MFIHDGTVPMFRKRMDDNCLPVLSHFLRFLSPFPMSSRMQLWWLYLLQVRTQCVRDSPVQSALTEFSSKLSCPSTF